MLKRISSQQGHIKIYVMFQKSAIDTTLPLFLNASGLRHSLQGIENPRDRYLGYKG